MWVLPGASAAPFELWSSGFSERYPVNVERLVAAAPIWDPEHLEEGEDFRLEWRTSSGTTTLWLVFESAPPSADKVRARFRRLYTVVTTTVEVPAHLHLAVAYKAAELQCAKLARAYASPVDLAVH